MAEEIQSQKSFDLPDIMMVDELPFWSAPFGIRLLEAVKYKKHIRALDIGCGGGFPLTELAMRLGSTCRVIGLDPDPGVLKLAASKVKLKGIGNIGLIEGTAENMPFGDGEFDLMVSNNGLNNVQDLSKALSECGRVASEGAQLVFTYNTADSFGEFYAIFKSVLRESGMQELQEKVQAHIQARRKPLFEYENGLTAAGFRIRSVLNDSFSYRFSDGTSMLNHFFIKNIFFPAWKEIVPAGEREKIFGKIESIINGSAENSRGFTMSVPFAAVDCEKLRNNR
jgi:arsenite methyltransferase